MLSRCYPRLLAWLGEHANLYANYMQIQGLPLGPWHPATSAACGSPHSGTWVPARRAGPELGPEKAFGKRGAFLLDCFQCPQETPPPGSCGRGESLPAWYPFPWKKKKKESSLNIYPPLNSSINKIILHQAEQGTKQVTRMESPKTRRR